MRFDELTLQDPDDELHVRFHPELTVLSGLGALERRSLAESIVGSVGGGREATTLRYVDADGHTLTAVGGDGRITAHQDDGSPATPPLGAVGADPVALRSLMLLSADDLGALTKVVREGEPPELREARAMLEELTAELNAALGQQQAVDALQAEVDGLEDELRSARDGVARREYAQVLARLERVRAEAAAIQAGTASVESDRHLLSSADNARALAAAWVEASERVGNLAVQLDGVSRLPQEERDHTALIPTEPPAGLDALIDELRRAAEARDALDQRLQALSVSKLPAPSHAAVAELGLLDQATLWTTADRLADAAEALQRLQVSLGGLEVNEMGPAPDLIESIEAAHTEVEAADRAADAARLPGFGGVGLGVAAGVIGFAAAPVLLPVGLLGAAVAAGAGIVRPGARRAKAGRTEKAALLRAEATSYLGFHIRRVEASVDPKLRELVETTMVEHRAALAGWLDVVGPEIDLEAARSLRIEIEAYNDALRNLGDTADEIEQLRRELHEQAEPVEATARDHLRAAIEPFLLTDTDLDDLSDLAGRVAWQCDRGAAARAQTVLDEAEVDLEKAEARLDDLLLELGFEAGPLDARTGALEWAVTRATEREDARSNARPRDEIDAEILQLQDAAAQLRRPEWATVTAADAATPDIPELEARRGELLKLLATASAEVDTERLADRHAAVERRVASLEARHGGYDVTGDPAAIADIQQHLLGHLATAATAGPAGDPVPVVLDEVFLRVPADRKWDLLDLLHRLAESHQLVYLSDDAFVAAWARQRALDGTITLLELAPEPV